MPVTLAPILFLVCVVSVAAVDAQQVMVASWTIINLGSSDKIPVSIHETSSHHLSTWKQHMWQEVCVWKCTPGYTGLVFTSSKQI